MDFSKCSYECGPCGARKNDVPISKGRPECCGEKMWISNKNYCAVKVWNTDPMTQTGEENARMCGVPI